MTYIAPLEDIKFALKHIAKYDKISALGNYEEFSWDLVEAVLEEGSKVASNILAPLNNIGDTVGSKMVDAQVVVPDGWQDALKEISKGGWIGLSKNTEFGGQGMPDVIAAAVGEMWQASNLAFSLCPLLTQGAMSAIELNASNELKKQYLPKMMEGTWTGTMNLTEPQAGSDLAAIRSKAIPNGDHYFISGQKIFITYGDHTMTENIIHLVLARTPDAPAGVKGISLFIVPKFLVNKDGSLGARNDLTCVSLEHKLGIHGSPTAVMSFGDNEGAIGYLVGEENRGLEYMFVMMNSARYEVGIQGLGVAEAAYQAALEYAKERVQGKVLGRKGTSPIIGHPDVRRMLLSMKSRIEAMRAVAYYAAHFNDIWHHCNDAEIAAQAGKQYEYLIPIVKGWLSEVGQEITSIGVQVHGGLGFIEETGAAQFYRDSRITTIYEGTTGIQAADLAFRKTARDGAQSAQLLIGSLKEIVTSLDLGSKTVALLEQNLLDAEDFALWIAETAKTSPQDAAAASDAYLRLMGTLIGAILLSHSACIAQKETANSGVTKEFSQAKIATAEFYNQTYLPQIPALIKAGKLSAATVSTYEDSWF